MKHFFRIMLGKQSAFAAECIAGDFVGVDFGIHEDLTDKLPVEWRAFNKRFIPIFLGIHPGKSRVAAGLACGALWTVAKGVQTGDVILCPDGSGFYHVGEIAGDYYYRSGGNLPHRRPIRWQPQTIDRNDMSSELRNSTGSGGTVSTVTGYASELQGLIAGGSTEKLLPSGETVEDPVAFVMEKHLEDFLVQNWSQTELGKEYDIFEEEGELVGQQYQSDTGPIDILAQSKDRKRLLVVELKKGKASDAVVGQILRYMGYVKEDLAENGQLVQGAIIALDDDQRIRRALAMVSNVTFYRYRVDFKIVKA